MKVHPIPDGSLGNTSYLLEIGGTSAVAIDPRRDVDVYEEAADRLGLRLESVVETHLHADFVSGNMELAAAGASIVVPAGAESTFPHRGIREGETLDLDGVRLRALETPGHTPEHLAYVVEGDDGVVGVFSGGSLIAGGAARTDLIDPALTEQLTRDQFASLRRVAELPDAAHLWPTHGGGSFCSAIPASAGATTIGAERATNPLLAITDEEEFVREVLNGYGSFPAYFLHLRVINQRGATLIADLPLPRALPAGEVAGLMEDGVWLIDVRSVDEWAAGHPRGAIAIAERPAFASWLGWVIPFGAPVVFLGDEQAVASATVAARGIGYDDVRGWVDGGLDGWTAAGLPVDSVESLSPADALRRVENGSSLVDVRARSEVAVATIPGAAQIEVGDIAAGKQPGVDDLITYCAHGERAATAASLLEHRGLRVATLAGGFPAWDEAGLPVQR